MKIEFIEKQKFTQWWFWLIILTIVLLLFIDFNEVYPSFNIKSNSIFTVIIVFVLVFFLTIMELRTKIDKNGIEMHFFPIVKKSVKWNDIKSVKVVNYGFVGGWGIRLFTKYGTVYNIKGNKGLAIELQNNNKFLIGTQKEEDLKKVISALEKKLKSSASLACIK